MGLAIDTFAASAVNPGAAFAAAAAVAGDSLSIKSFNDPATAILEQVIRGGTTAGGVRVRSPRFHDNVTGLKFVESAGVAARLLPQDYGERVYSVDTLNVDISGGGAETDLAVLRVYYSDLGGVNARLKSWGDISGMIDHLKTITVAVATGNVATWADTGIATTEDLLEADKDYALLGYTVDVATTAVGIKGTDTGGLRICGPGLTDTTDTSDIFVRHSERSGRPHIPIIASNNKGGTFVSTIHHAATQNVNVELVFALLSQKV
jgi:hypothetical protein